MTSCPKAETIFELYASRRIVGRWQYHDGGEDLQAAGAAVGATHALATNGDMEGALIFLFAWPDPPTSPQS